MNQLKRYIIGAPEERMPEILRMLHSADVLTEEYPENPRVVVIRHPEEGMVAVPRAEAHWRMLRINAWLAERGITPALERPEYPDDDWSGQLMELALREFDWEGDHTPTARFDGGEAEWLDRIVPEYPEAFRGSAAPPEPSHAGREA